ncbi:MAG TPA: MDR family MFS transporter [Bacillales bacterium]
MLSEKWLVVVSVLLGAFTLILNNSMMNPALPYFEELFHADAVAVSWILTIFMVTMGMAMPLTGYLSEKIGKKNLFMIGLALFTAGSIAGSFSWSLGSIIFFRAVQGIAGGVMIPLAMALIFEVFPHNERGKAMGVYGIAAMVAPTIGPTLGGFLIENFSWRYLFLANVPTGILGLIMCTIYLKRPARNPEKQFDYKGFVMVTLGIGTMLFAFSRMQTVEQLTNPLNIALVGFGVACLVIFGLIEKRTSDPLLNLELFGTPAFSLAVWISSIGTIGLFASIFLLPFLIQSVYGYSAVATGLVLLPSAVFTGIFMNIGGRILDKSGPTAVVPIGLAISALMMFLFYFVGLQTPLWIIVFLMALRGMGMGFTNMPANTTGMNSIPDPMVAQGSAMNNVVRRIASALGVVFISVFFQVRKMHLVAAGDTAQQAAMTAINEAYLIIGILTVVTIPAGIFLGIKSKEGQRRKKVASAS